jgi:hypothetical protein
MSIMIAVAAAAWMFDRIRRQEELRLHEAVFEIGRLFGAECVRMDSDGSVKISPTVLKALRLLTGDSVAWNQSAQAWQLQNSGSETIH